MRYDDGRARESILLRAAPGTPACLRSLGRLGINTVVFSHREDAPSFFSRHCHERAVVPSPTDDSNGYRDAIISLARREDVRTILPMDEDDVFVLSKYRDSFTEHVSPLWPSFELLQIVHDRTRLVEAAAAAGVSVPETRLLNEVETWDRELIVKARYSLLSADYVDTVPPGHTRRPGDVTYHGLGSEPDLESLCREMNHVPIVQEYVPGEEYALWALYDRGEAVATCQKRQVRGQSYAGGTSVYRETVREPSLEAAGRALLDHLEWHGLASVQFKRDHDSGEFTLLEVNPRAWISLSCAVRAGVDFPRYFWQVATGEDVQCSKDYDEGVGSHRIAGELRYLTSILREDNPIVEPPPFWQALRIVAASLLDQPCFDYFASSDPSPFARDVRNKVDDRLGTSRLPA